MMRSSYSLVPEIRGAADYIAHLVKRVAWAVLLIAVLSLVAGI